MPEAMNGPPPTDHAGEELIAYFCAEYAVDPQLPIYAGGLGVLAGDHLKSAGDLGVPLVAIGLFYGEGYLTQQIDAAGRQQAGDARFDPVDAGLYAVQDPMGRELRVRIPMAGHLIQARVWRRHVGPVPLFLLDANVPENAPEDRGITARLYDAGHDVRLKQEMVLGIGGVRAIRALGLRPSVWHINEGHAAFQVLERMRERIAWGQRFDAALEAVAASTVFTTHTPVAAGHDVFTHGQLRHWFGKYLAAMHTAERRLFALGANGDGGDRFSMTALALRASRYRNAVSRLHREVAARMERYAWPQVEPELGPIGHVTNGVHLPTFLAPAWLELLDRQLPGWRGRVVDPQEMKFLDALDDGDLAALRTAARGRLLDELRERLADQHRRNGTAAAVLERMLAGLDAARGGMPVIGFARRFASYKRATLLLQDAPRLARLLGHAKRPAILAFAGKAHPNDHGGQELIRQLYEAAQRPELLGRMFVIEGYDLPLARLLVQGCDIWLNTPVHPMEACGTSGMKSGANGGINLAVLDGWWAEAYDGSNGFALEPAATADPGERDRQEAARLFEMLEQQVLPEFYGASERGPSTEWLARVRRSVRYILPRFSSARMFDEYRRHYYMPAADHGRRLEADRGKLAAGFARWKRLVLARWPGVKLEPQPGDGIRVLVGTNGITAGSIAVELQSGAEDFQALRLQSNGNGLAEFVWNGPAPRGTIALRAYPTHELLAHPFELGLMIRLETAVA
jgi:starch phosphorylase